jgi:CheY-like chemotaxis protein
MSGFRTWLFRSTWLKLPNMKPVRILIAEDDTMIAMFLEELLEVMGHEVCAVVCDQSGVIAAAAQHAPDLMIVDEGLRVGSGIAAVAEILQTGFIPHIFATGHDHRVLSHNPDAIVLQKPYSAQALSRAIERALQPLAETR